MASKTDSTKIVWQVQIRTIGKKWRNKGTFETRRNARDAARWFREGLGHVPAFGFGNTRVLRHVRGGGR